MQSNFQKWLVLSTTLSETSIKKYIGAISRIDDDLAKTNIVQSSLEEIDSAEELEQIKNYYFSIPEYKELNARGHSMYSAAFNRFISYKGSEDSKKINTWIDCIIEALIKLGKPSHLSKIYEQVKIIRQTNNLSWPVKAEAIIRRTLESKSSDSQSWQGGEDLFGNFEKGEGIWYLKGNLYTKNKSTTQMRAYINARVGQGDYRDDLLNIWNNSCSISKIEHPSILIASHIKPWRFSDDYERLDPYNGFLLLPNLDKLFDIGFITFKDNGEIIISDEINSGNYKTLGISNITKVDLFEHNKKYLKFHREKIFRKTKKIKK